MENIGISVNEQVMLILMNAGIVDRIPNTTGAASAIQGKLKNVLASVSSLRIDRARAKRREFRHHEYTSHSWSATVQGNSEPFPSIDHVTSSRNCPDYLPSRLSKVSS
jgi:hypothetical protein